MCASTVEAQKTWVMAGAGLGVEGCTGTVAGPGTHTSFRMSGFSGRGVRARKGLGSRKVLIWVGQVGQAEEDGRLSPAGAHASVP